MNLNLLVGSLLPLLLTTPAAFAQGAKLLVAQKGDQSLAIVDPEDGRVVANVAENGVTGHEVAASPDGRIAVVPIYGNSGVGKPGTDGSNIVFIDLATRKIVGNVQFPHGVRPHCPVFGPDGLLYVTTELDHTITIIDPEDLQDRRRHSHRPAGEPHAGAFARRHARLHGQRGAGNGFGARHQGAQGSSKIIPVSGEVQRIAISNDDRWVFTADQTKPQMAVIDTATLKVAKWVPLDGLGYGAAPSKDGRWLLVAVPASNDVDVIDLQNHEGGAHGAAGRRHFAAGSAGAPRWKRGLCLLRGHQPRGRDRPGHVEGDAQDRDRQRDGRAELGARRVSGAAVTCAES